MGGVAAETVVFRCAAPLRPAASAPGSTYEPQLGVSRPLSVVGCDGVVVGGGVVVGRGARGARHVHAGFFPREIWFFFRGYRITNTPGVCWHRYPGRLATHPGNPGNPGNPPGQPTRATRATRATQEESRRRTGRGRHAEEVTPPRWAAPPGKGCSVAPRR